MEAEHWQLGSKRPLLAKWREVTRPRLLVLPDETGMSVRACSYSYLVSRMRSNTSGAGDREMVRCVGTMLAVHEHDALLLSVHCGEHSETTMVFATRAASIDRVVQDLISRPGLDIAD